MRDNSKDRTIERNYVQKYRFLISEYEQMKAKKHPQFRFLQDFYRFHGTHRCPSRRCHPGGIGGHAPAGRRTVPR